MEALVQKVERDGFKRFTFERVEPKLPDESLAFRAQGNTIEKEKTFRTAWVSAMKMIAEAVEAEAKEAQKDKDKDKAALAGKRDAAKLFAAVAPRLQEVRALSARPVEKETFDQREIVVKKFLKRYDFGPKIAKGEALGTAVINVSIAPSIWDVVKRTVYSWKFAPLKDKDGKEVTFGKRRVEFTEQLNQSELREALKMLQNEVFIVRYARWENEKETDNIRVTGARLLLGTYYFIEHEDRLIVAREPGAK